MYREITEQLKQWKNKPDRKPLILNGARQVGKTYSLREFGKNEYAKVAYINCENSHDVQAIFEGDYDMRRIVLMLSALTNVTITPGDTLIIIDEIQENARALNALKYFCEDAPEYHVAVAGSLLGVSLHSGVSFPVGKVDMLRMYPMTFNEFLIACGREQLVEVQQTGAHDVVGALANTYIDLLRQYYYVGGMPVVVREFVKNQDLKQVRELQKNILFNYTRDFSKHAPEREVPRINMVWNAIPAQLAKENKKFIYGALKPGARAAEFEIAIQWLIDAGLVYQVFRAKEPTLPLKFYEDMAAFKLFMLDVGLMGAMTDTPSESVLVRSDAFTEYKGAFTELYVLTQLKPMDIPIYYFSSNDSRVEIDFLLQNQSSIVPTEVKAEVNVKAKSLHTYVEKHPNLKGLRLSMLPYADQGWMTNRPLYAPAMWLA